MIETLHILRGYFETNHFTLHLVLALAVVSVFKYLPFPRVSPRVIFWGLVVLGLFLRISWIGFSNHTVKTAWSDTVTETDLIQIHASDTAHGVWFRDAQGLPTARRPIGYPVFLGFFYKFFGPHPEVAWALSLGLFAATAMLLRGMGGILFGGRAALWAVFLWCVYPVSIYSAKLLTDEHLFVPLWFLGLWLLLREINGKRLPFAVLIYGVIFGYATMTRTHSIFMPFTAALAYILMRSSWKKVVFLFVGVTMIMQLVNLPWIVRNYRVWGVPVSYTATGFFVYSQVNSFAGPRGGGHIPLKGEEGYSEEVEAAKNSGNEALYHVACNRAMKHWILTHPAQFAVLGAGRLLYFMGWNRDGIWPLWFQFYENCYDPAHPIAQAAKDFFEEAAHSFYYSLFFLFIFGQILLWRRFGDFSRSSRIALVVIGSCFIFWWVEHMIIYPDRKYRFPIEVLMMLFAGYFLDHVATNFRWEKLKFPWLRKKVA